MALNIPCISSNAAGESIFTTEEFPLSTGDMQAEGMPKLSAIEGARRYAFIEHCPGWSRPAAPASRRQFVMCIEGGGTLTVSNGDEMKVAKGDIWIEEDVTGEGHAFSISDAGIARFFFVQVE